MIPSLICNSILLIIFWRKSTLVSSFTSLPQNTVALRTSRFINSGISSTIHYVHHAFPTLLSSTQTEPAATNEESSLSSSAKSSSGIITTDDLNLQIPDVLLKTLSKREITSLLPVQHKSYDLVMEGSDAVIHAPTGSGKTLAFVLPLIARLVEEDKKNAKEPQIKPTNAPPTYTRGSVSASRTVKPRILTIVPSRELAKQVAKEYSKHYHNSVVAVFGGAPIDRHAALLRQKNGADVVVGTAGRIRELMREEHLGFGNLETIVLDEADTLLDFKDNPEVEMFLEEMDHDYQMVLVSATINQFVRNFSMDIMEVDETSKTFVTVGRKDELETAVRISNAKGNIDNASTTNDAYGMFVPKVLHSCTATRSSLRPQVSADFISLLSPRITIIFVNTKSEVEKVAFDLSSRLSDTADVRIMHGDMTQSVRSRTIQFLRESSRSMDVRRKMQVLVATDVASRGIDLPGVDLVLQFGIPRAQGKEGTINSELYTHRSGRAGRVGGDVSQNANAIMLYDPSEGEGKLLSKLKESLRYSQGVHQTAEINGRPLPTVKELMDSAYGRVRMRCDSFGKDDEEEKDDSAEKLVQLFKTKLVQEEIDDDVDQNAILIDRLARAMAALSNLDCIPKSRSLLTADPKKVTVCISRNNDLHEKSITPTEVTELCKSLGSGKLGRVFILDNGSKAVFDLPKGRAEKLVEQLEMNEERSKEWHSEIPDELGEVFS
eukprot:CAMPEP_0194416264 /NCGR_PEP_ID=MMETSP0176-20130528/15192_1 /TAXON_ID=216777 /ORGANISM="Proboscia alata, Strain PI-D3" /LENGTH=718 /DNA_ID=CAMNT_0039221459 /DNA_START=122 /DNA_END=2275 /DNA_ORIENTATION=-